jgi:hypothetical protein
MRGLSCLMLITVILAVGPAPGAAATPGKRPVCDTLLVTEAPKLDGRLDDACWQKAPVLDRFTQVLPVEGGAPSEKTEVRFVHTHEKLFIAVRCFDSEPDRIIAKTLRRDSEFTSDDAFQIVFDTFNRQRDGYFFAVNPAGARTDALFGMFSDFNRQWDTVWDARTKVDESGWTVEIEIPFKSLSFDPSHETWGMNCERIIRRKQETVRWTGVSRAKTVMAMENFGELAGFKGLRQGLGLQFKPYVRGTYQDNRDEAHGKFDFQGGFDLTYRITPTLTVQGTVLPDFAETDVDARIVNLSRFPVFFPEKRDFFLQDSSLFSFGGLPASASPFFSRRIGLGIDGQPVDIYGGGRITGRIGGTSLALLDVQQESHAGIESKNLGVARISQQVFTDASIGGIFTRGDPRSNGHGMLGGLDFSFRNGHLSEDRVITGNAYVMFSDADSAGGSDWAFGADLDYPNEPLDVHLLFRQWGRQFRPTLGFVPRVGIREYMASFRYIWRPNTALIRSISLGVRPFFTTDLDNKVVAEDHDAPVLNFVTPAGDMLKLEYTYYRDVLDEPFEIQPGIRIPAGNYGYGQFKPAIRTSDARPVSAGIGLRWGDFYSGTRFDLGSSLTWRPTRHFTLGVAYDYQSIDLREGAFVVHLANLNANIPLSPDLSWNTVVQYDNISKHLGLNSRIRWTWRPGNDVFLVVNNGWQYETGEFRGTDTAVTLKVGSTLRF